MGERGQEGDSERERVRETERVRGEGERDTWSEVERS